MKNVLMRVNIGGWVVQRTIKPSDVAVLGPVDELRGDGAQAILGFCPGAPGGIFQPYRV